MIKELLGYLVKAFLLVYLMMSFMRGFNLFKWSEYEITFFTIYTIFSFMVFSALKRLKE